MATPMTINGAEALREEVAHRKGSLRQEITQAIAEARAHGDLKENAEYHAAKEKQSIMEGRIAQLQGIVASSEVVDPSQVESDKVVFGATVTILNVETDESTTYQIVGEPESDINRGKISYNSPLGKALIGKEEGDEVIVKAPKGDIEYEVEEIEYK